MSKFKSISLLIVGVGMLYAVLAIFIGFLADTTISVNQSLAVAHNGLVAYPGLSGAILSAPWALYFAPAIIGIVWLIIILKQRNEG